MDSGLLCNLVLNEQMKQCFATFSDIVEKTKEILVRERS